MGKRGAGQTGKGGSYYVSIKAKQVLAELSAKTKRSPSFWVSHLVEKFGAMVVKDQREWDVR